MWGAEDLEDPGTRVVVKFIPPEADVFGYRQQGSELADLETHGLVAPIDSGESAGGRPFFVFPFVDGSTLREVLNASGPMSFRRAASILRQLGRVLAAAHSRHIAHGAIEPEHILVAHERGREVVYVINFGSWRVASAPSTPPGYLAPEAREGQVTISGDIYSLAAVAAEMLTGRRAFRYGSVRELERLQRIGLPRGSLRQIRHQIPARVEDEIRKALSWDPAHRPADVLVFANRLADGLGEGAALPLRRVLLFGGLLAVVAGASAYRACRRP